MRESDNKQFLDRLRANPRQFENPNFLRDIILNHPHSRLFLQVRLIARELLAEGQTSADTLSALLAVDVLLPGIVNRFMGERRSETLVETVLKVIRQQPESKLVDETNWLQKTFIACFMDSALPNNRNLKNFLIYSSPELVTLFFEQLNAAIRKGIIPRENSENVFNSLIQGNFLDLVVKNNRMLVLKGLKTLGCNLSSASSCIHTLAGSATIATVDFLLEQGIDINSKDRNNHTTIWYIIKNIETISRAIGTDHLFYRPNLRLYNDWDVLSPRLDSLTSRKRFMCDNFNKALFLLEKGAEITSAEAKELDSSLTLFAGKYARNKAKYPEVPFAKMQYFWGIVKEKLGKSQEASYHFIEAATQGDRGASLKLAEYYLLTKKEEDALIWYQQAIHNSAAPKPTLLQLIGIEKMIQLAHGISLRKTETDQDLRKDYAFILRELKGVDYSKETISVDGLLQLAHLAIEHDASPKQYKLALQLTCAAYNKARSEEKPRLIQTTQQDTQHVMNRILDNPSAAEAKYHAGVDFMPFPSDCGIAHYYRLCLELAKLNLDLESSKENSGQRVHYWVEMAAILGHKDMAIFSQNLRETIEAELHNIASVMPSFSGEHRTAFTHA